jgi:hypothetical protein
MIIWALSLRTSCSLCHQILNWGLFSQGKANPFSILSERLAAAIVYFEVRTTFKIKYFINEDISHLGEKYGVFGSMPFTVTTV